MIKALPARLSMVKRNKKICQNLVTIQKVKVKLVEYFSPVSYLCLVLLHI